MSPIIYIRKCAGVRVGGGGGGGVGEGGDRIRIKRNSGYIVKATRYARGPPALLKLAPQGPYGALYAQFSAAQKSARFEGVHHFPSKIARAPDTFLVAEDTFLKLAMLRRRSRHRSASSIFDDPDISVRPRSELGGSSDRRNKLAAKP